MSANSRRDKMGEIFPYDGINFELSPMTGHAGPSDVVVVQKGRWMVDRYLELQQEFTGADVAELGLWDGGSTVLLSAILQPRKLLAVELETDPLPQLENYIADRSLADQIVLALGVDQSDRETLAALVHDTFGDAELDLVIDDASHLYGPTCTSFDLLFPLLRPGGLFIIEDWSQEHEFESALGPALQQMLAAGTLDHAKIEEAERNRATAPPPLGRLALELVGIVASGRDVISELRIQRGWMEIRRGSAPLDRAAFDRGALLGRLAQDLLAP